MKFEATGLLLGVALLTVPVAAQQEVNPDHFPLHDEKANVSQPRKPASQARRAAGTKNKQVAVKHGSSQAKPQPALRTSADLKADAGSGQTGSSPR
jgi:hypothetical protein